MFFLREDFCRKYFYSIFKVIGRELSLALADYILKAYSDRDPKIRRFLRNIDLHILHSMNPDGFEKASMDPACKGRHGRENANFVSLKLRKSAFKNTDISQQRPNIETEQV